MRWSGPWVPALEPAGNIVNGGSLNAIEMIRALSAIFLPVRSYRPGTWGPNAIHQLIAPNAWRLPFERTWRDPNFYEA